MTKRYWLILISFIIMQLATSLVTIPLLMAFGFSGTTEELFGTSILITFTVGFFIIALITWRAGEDEIFMRNRANTSDTVLWSILGIFMAFGAQMVAAFIQMEFLGIEPGSENTQVIVEWATAVPLMIIVVAVFVPVMEEIVFRKVIFGSLYKRYGFWIGALLSGLIFAVVHMDFKNLLVYLTMGIVFAFLYVKTKRIIVPIMAHVGINSFVMLVQVVFGEQLQRFIEEVDNLQAVIGGLF
ncbi:MAG: CPBP family intramembrane metalloprotease [Bacillus sp. (in: Bacteria)]|nr:CPBP family intramembrane metalloprotease [Bacillus sp. (in: firmicutes)]